MRQNNNGNIDHAVLSPRSGTALPSEHGSIFRQEAEKLLEKSISWREEMLLSKRCAARPVECIDAGMLEARSLAGIERTPK